MAALSRSRASSRPPGTVGTTTTVALASDGAIIVARVEPDYAGVQTLVVSRLDGSGNLDADYGSTVPLGKDLPGDVALAALPNGQVLVAGESRSGPDVPVDDAAASFSPANPSPGNAGTFSFGYKGSPAGAFTRYGFYDENDGNEALESHSVGDNAVPAVSKNVSPWDLQVGEVSVPAGRLLVRPGANGSRAMSAVRFTAAVTGTYRIDSYFQAADPRGATGAAHVVSGGGTVLWTEAVNGVGTSRVFTSQTGLRAGDTLDFVVSNGGNGPSGDGMVVGIEIRLVAPSPRDFYVLRLTRDGRPDVTFDRTAAAAPGGGMVPTDMGAGEAARAVAVQPDGRILVAGSSWAGRQYPDGGQFAIARYLGDRRAPDGDGDDQMSEAPRVEPGAAPVGGSLASGADVDIYEVVVGEAGRRVGFDVDGNASDALLRLFTRAGAELAMNDNGPGRGEAASVDPYLEFTFSAPGTYYVGVSASANRAYNPVTGEGDRPGGTGGGNYTFTLTDRTAVAPADGDDQLKEARPTAIGTAADGKIDRSADVDVLSFTAATGQRVAFDVATLSGALRPHLRLLAEDGTELAAGDSTEVNGSSREFTFSGAGTYYVAVSSRPNVAYNAITSGNDAGAGGAAGTYRLRLQGLTPGSLLLPAEDAAIAGAKVTADNAGYTGTGYGDFVNTSGDNVEWSPTVPSAGAYTLAFRYANGGSKDRLPELRANRQVISPTVAFQPTGGWSDWKTLAVSVKLSLGVNTIRLTALGTSGPNIDLLNVLPGGR